MPELWKVAAAIAGTSVASVSGTLLIKLGVEQNNISVAILGSALWSLSGAAFAFAAGRAVDLSVLAGLTSAGALLITTLLAITMFGEPPTVTRLIAIALICGAMVMLALPTASS